MRGVWFPRSQAPLGNARARSRARLVYWFDLKRKDSALIAKKKSPIRLGLIGLGRAGWGMHCKALDARQDKFQIVAACDTDRARVRKMVERYGCAGYADAAQLIADPNVELVDIASRTPVHVSQALAALRAGKDVFLEKPISLTFAEAKRLKAASEKSEGTLYVRHNRRFEPAFQHIREILDSGVLGRVYDIKLRRHGYQRRDDWQTLMRCGGGQLLNWGPHIIDHALQFLRYDVKEIWSDLKRVAAVGDAEDHVRILMKGGDGCVVDIEISGGAAIPEPEYVIFGTKGALVCRGSEIQLKHLDPKQKLRRIRAKSSNPPMEGGFGNAEKLRWIEKTLPVSPKTKCRTEDIWDHLYAAIREGAPFPITLDEAVAVMEVVSRVKRGTEFA